MTVPTLDQTLEILRANKAMLRTRGVVHAAIFGSVARETAQISSDVDILVDLEPGKPCGIFEYARLQRDMADLLGRKVDLVERDALKPLARAQAMKEAVDVF